MEYPLFIRAIVAASRIRIKPVVRGVLPRVAASVGDGAQVVAAIHAYLARQEQEQSAVRAVETA